MIKMVKFFQKQIRIAVTLVKPPQPQPLLNQIDSFPSTHQYPLLSRFNATFSVVSVGLDVFYLIIF